MTDELKLKTFDALLRQYHWLYVKEFAYGGLKQNEFEELKCFFIEACHMAKPFLTEFVRKYDGIDTDDFDRVIERAEHWRVLQYSDCWKRMYHVLLPHAEANSMTQKEKDRVFSAYDLLKIPNYSLAAWHLIEKENGVTGKDNPELLCKLLKFLSCNCEGPFWYDYPGVPFSLKAEFWDMAEKKDYGDIHPDAWDGYVWECFENKTIEYMTGQGIQYPQTIPAELEVKFTSPCSFVPPLFDEREMCILSALKDTHALEIIYFSFENGISHLSSECITPIKMKYTHHYWTLVGIDEKRETKEYVVPQMLEVKTK